MKIYQLRQEQFLPISLDKAWNFFSTPKNLEKITPEDMSFQILSDLGDGKAYAGQIINYKVSPFKGVKMRWTTEICHCEDRKYFVDEQRFGPYSFWHHKHFFNEVEGGVKMIDIVDYALPLGILGQLAHTIFVRKKLVGIFEYRFQILEKKFSQ
jgi:ligand-binding SRPBCC domain-containing protein